MIEYAHVFHEVVASEFTAVVLELTESNLGDDSAKLPARSRDTVGGRAIARRENLTGYNESCDVGPEVLEEVGEAVEEDERLSCRRSGSQLFVSEACDLILAHESIYRFCATHPGY